MKRAVATSEQIALARHMRKRGASLADIAAATGFGRPWVSKVTAPTKRKSRPVPALEKRIRNLARRGFDVPPSKQDDWTRLVRAGVPVSERVRILGLE